MLLPIVDAAWLAAHRDDVVLADVRFYLDGRSARAAFDAGHLPGAVYVDLERWLAAPGTPKHGRHPLPTPETFAEGMSACGIGDDTQVVAYDDAGGVIAARLVWMLRALGRDAALLNGGIGAWDGPLETDEQPVAPASFTATPWPADRLASADDAAETTVNLVIDARQRERFAGAPDDVDPRAGHIPGAHALPCREHLASDDRLLPVDTLRARLSDAGIDGSTPVISYCGSGVTACHNLLVIEHAGLGTGRLYPGSWSQWSHDAARPVATSDRP
ncbi:sulfurtransferase [Baekduia sp. Peel2402]|uniref:sulfurtransferase n=1 Tax=Baekduia sp. Peel2402 TaxID=3458296 RepID=UPI00403EEC5F